MQHIGDFVLGDQIDPNAHNPIFVARRGDDVQERWILKGQPGLAPMQKVQLQARTRVMQAQPLPNCVIPRAIVMQQDTLFVARSTAPSHSLDHILSDLRQRRLAFGLETALSPIMDLLRALTYLHSLRTDLGPLVHGAVEASHVLINDRGQALLLGCEHYRETEPVPSVRHDLAGTFALLYEILDVAQAKPLTKTQQRQHDALRSAVDPLILRGLGLIKDAPECSAQELLSALEKAFATLSIKADPQSWSTWVRNMGGALPAQGPADPDPAPPRLVPASPVSQDPTLQSPQATAQDRTALEFPSALPSGGSPQQGPVLIGQLLNNIQDLSPQTDQSPPAVAPLLAAQMSPVASPELQPASYQSQSQSQGQSQSQSQGQSQSQSQGQSPQPLFLPGVPNLAPSTPPAAGILPAPLPPIVQTPATVQALPEDALSPFVPTIEPLANTSVPATAASASRAPQATADSPAVNGEPEGQNQESLFDLGKAQPADRRLLGEILQSHNQVSPAQIDQALAQKRQLGGRIGEQLVAMGAINPEQLAQALAIQQGLAYFSPRHLATLRIPQALLQTLPQAYVRAKRVLPLAYSDTRAQLLLAVANPIDQSSINEARVLIASPSICVVVASDSSIQACAQRHFADRQAPRTDQSDRPLCLVASADSELSETLRQRLHNEGYAAQIASDGAQARSLIEEGQISALIAALSLPKVDGYNLILTARSREATQDIPIFVYSSRADDYHMSKALELGADDFIPLPLNFDFLLSKLRRALKAKAPVQAAQAISSGVSGSLQDMPLNEIVQAMEFGRKTALVNFLDTSEALGELGFVDGQIAFARCADSLGEDAFYRLATLNKGFFQIHYGERSETRNVNNSTTFLLLEAMRRKDEGLR